MKPLGGSGLKRGLEEIDVTVITTLRLIQSWVDNSSFSFLQFGKFPPL
jgi:hypothetical protein